MGGPSDIHYSALASSLNKRPIGDIQDELKKKKRTKDGEQQKPAAKKKFKNINPRVEVGVQRQSFDLTAKKRDELFGRVSPELVAKFLTKKLTQH